MALHATGAASSPGRLLGNVQDEEKPLLHSKVGKLKADVDISNQATRVFRNAAITFLALTAIAGLMILSAHGGSLIQSYAGVGAGGLTVVAGIVYLALKLCRDRPEKNRVAVAWKGLDQREHKRSLESLQEGEKLSKTLTISGKKYELILEPGKKIQILSK